MPIFRRTLTVAAVTAVGTFAFALPAWAHSANFDRDCGQVALHLNDNFPAGTYTIDVFRDGTQVDEFTYVPGTTSPDKTYPESNEGTITYKLTWVNGNDHGQSAEELPAPENCAPAEDNPPADDNPPGDNENPPAEDNPPTDTETETTPAKAPATTTAAPATTSPAPAAVNADKLANTGAGNTVPLLVVGTVLVAGGVGLTFMTRRRHSGNASS